MFFYELSRIILESKGIEIIEFCIVVCILFILLTTQKATRPQIIGFFGLDPMKAVETTKLVLIRVS